MITSIIILSFYNGKTVFYKNCVIFIFLHILPKAKRELQDKYNMVSGYVLCYYHNN